MEARQVFGKGGDQGLAEGAPLQHRRQQLALIELHHPHGLGEFGFGEVGPITGTMAGTDHCHQIQVALGG